MNDADFDIITQFVTEADWEVCLTLSTLFRSLVNAIELQPGVDKATFRSDLLDQLNRFLLDPAGLHTEKTLALAKQMLVKQ